MNTILITGAAKRIGRGLAIRLAQKGFNIIVNYNKSKNEAEDLKLILNKINNQLGNKSYFIQTDVSILQNVKEMFKQIEKEFILPNVLINNTGIFTPSTDITNLDDTTWHNTIDTNLSSQFYCSKEFFSNVKSHNLQNARIINIASLGGTEVWKNRTPYNVSKAGVIQLTKSLARDLAPFVSVNCISPGTIFFPEEEASEPLRTIESKIPWQRHGNIDDIFDAVYLFISSSPFITGNNLIVDGGYSLAR